MSESLAEAYQRLLRETEERAAELERLNAELREVDRLKTEFLSMISHELRTPLTAIIGYTDLLLRGTHGELNERQLRHQQAVKHGAQRLLGIINDLLDVSRLDSGLIELDEAEVSLTSIFQQALEAVREAAADARLSLRVEQPADLPPVRGRALLLEQVLINLLLNARDAMLGAASPKRRITLAAWAEGGWVTLSIADTGPGIPEAVLPRLFEPFFTTKPTGQGTGLGLSLCQGIMQSLGGELTAGNGPQGAEFRLRMRIATAAMPMAQAVQPAQPARNGG